MLANVNKINELYVDTEVSKNVVNDYIKAKRALVEVKAHRFENIATHTKLMISVMRALRPKMDQYSHTAAVEIAQPVDGIDSTILILKGPTAHKTLYLSICYMCKDMLEAYNRKDCGLDYFDPEAVEYHKRSLVN